MNILFIVYTKVWIRIVAENIVPSTITSLRKWKKKFVKWVKISGCFILMDKHIHIYRNNILSVINGQTIYGSSSSYSFKRNLHYLSDVIICRFGYCTTDYLHLHRLLEETLSAWKSSFAAREWNVAKSHSTRWHTLTNEIGLELVDINREIRRSPINVVGWAGISKLNVPDLYFVEYWR